MSVSIVIPCYTLNDQLELMAFNCARGYKEFADEVIIVEDGGNKSSSLLDVADTYVYHSDNRGFTKNLNLGWSLARGDYTFLVNSDTYIEAGDPKDLCIPGKVTSPFYPRMPNAINFLIGSFFVVPREVQRERGMLDERYRTYYSDDDYGGRVQDIFQSVPSVEFGHVYGGTIVHLPEDFRAKERARDMKIYEKATR